MRRLLTTFALVLAGLAAAGTVAATGGGVASRSLSLSGSPLQLVAADGKLWVLTCDRGCSGQGRRSVGRIVEIDPQNTRLLASVKLARPGSIAVDAQGVYATDFWRGTVRRLDPRTLQLSATLHLKLPFFIGTSAARDDAFLPEAIAVAGGDVWVATARGALARADPQLRHVIAVLRLPGDAFQALAVSSGAVWLSESLLGIYRVAAKTNKVVARLPIGPASGRFDPVQIIAADKQLLAVGEWTSAGILSNRNGLARLDPRLNSVAAVTALPGGQLTSAYGAGSLWVGRVNGTTLEQIDPRNGKTLQLLHRHVGLALALTPSGLWTIFRNGTLQRLPIH